MEAIYGMAGIYFAIGVGCLLLSLWGRNPKHLGAAVGKLADSKKVMRRADRYSDKKVPVTTSIYLYEVNGKTYRLKHDGRFGRSTLMRRVTVIYMKPFPRCGHLDKFPSGQFTMLGAICIVGAVLFLLMPWF